MKDNFNNLRAEKTFLRWQQTQKTKKLLIIPTV